MSSLPRGYVASSSHGTTFLLVHASDRTPMRALSAPLPTVPTHFSPFLEQDAGFHCHITVESHVAMFV